MVAKQKLQINMFYIHALKEYTYFNSHNKTNKCMYVKRVYHVSLITDMFQSPL